MTPNFKCTRDRRGEYSIDWTKVEDRDGVIATGIQFVPFSAGDARVMSVPAEESMFMATGRRELEYGLIALRVGDNAVHLALSPAGMRDVAASLIRIADLIEPAG